MTLTLDDKFIGLSLSVLPRDLRAKLFDGIDPVELGTVVFDHKTNQVYLKVPKIGDVPFITIPEYKKLIESKPEIQKYLQEHDFLIYDN
ncbi:MAG: hypothetical protein QXH80_00630 [Candidatus Nanoarchaeia archaeon]